MSLGRVFSTLTLSVLMCSFYCCAQESSPPQGSTVSVTQPPPKEPNVLEDGGFSLEPMYWYTRAQPTLKGGATATTFENQSFPGHSNAAIGAEVGIPTGHSNTLRISYFRLQGNSATTETQDVTVFGQAYSAGDYVTSSYTLQSAKISWDYLSYTWHRERGNIHFKTLYEAQFTNISPQFAAPYKAVTTDSSGNVNDNTASASRHVFLPTLGGELEQAIGKRFRWEVKGSGFGLPHHSAIGDVQADVALRVHNFELIAGEKAYYFKTSPKGEQFFSDMLSGVFAGIRYYVGGPAR
jgi:hypothetical protein